MIEFSRWVNCLQTCDPGLLTTYSYILARPVFAVALWVIQSNNTSVNYSSDSISPTRQWRREICLHRSPTTPAPFLTSSFAPAVVFFFCPAIADSGFTAMAQLDLAPSEEVKEDITRIRNSGFDSFQWHVFLFPCFWSKIYMITWNCKKKPRFSSSQGLDIVLRMVPCSLCRCGQCYCI